MNLNLENHLCEERVYKTIFLQNYKLLRNYLNYKFKDFDVAEDYTQHSFLILWENCAKIKPIQAKKFLFTTSYRLALNHYRNVKVDRTYKENIVSESIDYLSPDILFDENEMNKKIFDAIQQLPEKQRIVFMMNRFEDQTYREIAELLEISIKSVEKRMHRALLSLKVTLK